MPMDVNQRKMATEFVKIKYVGILRTTWNVSRHYEYVKVHVDQTPLKQESTDDNPERKKKQHCYVK